MQNVLLSRGILRPVGELRSSPEEEGMSACIGDGYGNGGLILEVSLFVSFLAPGTILSMLFYETILGY